MPRILRYINKEKRFTERLQNQETSEATYGTSRTEFYPLREAWNRLRIGIGDQVHA